ncbi:MAG: hypothetical protein NXI31_05690 [bacterium]|nr:hypothetical protein [bacterium]
MVGGAAVAIVVLVLLLSGGGSDDDDNGGSGDQNGAAAPAAAPEQPKRTPSVGTGNARAGKTPERPAPALSHETLNKLDELLAEAKTFYNEGVKARNDGQNTKAREAQAKAKQKLDAWEKLVEAQLEWQEEAEMGDWAQPAEYDLLTRRYPKFSKLQKSVRMGGGK